MHKFHRFICRTIKSLIFLRLPAIIIPVLLFILACSPDEEEAALKATPLTCDEEHLSQLLVSDQGYLIKELSKVCLASDSSELQCVGHSGMFFYALKDHFKTSLFISEIAGVLGAFRNQNNNIQAKLGPMASADLIQTFLQSHYETLSNLQITSTNMKDNGCEFEPEFGISLNTGIHIEEANLTLFGKWGDIEADLINAFAGIVKPLFSYLVSHNYQIPLVNFSEILHLADLPAFILGMKSMILTGGLFGFYEYREEFLQQDLADFKVAIESLLSIVDDPQLISAPRPEYILSVHDNNSSGSLDSGDGLFINLEFTGNGMTFASHSFPNASLILGDCDEGNCTDSACPSLLDRIDLFRKMEYSLSSTGPIDCSADNNSCLTLNDIALLFDLTPLMLVPAANQTSNPGYSWEALLGAVFNTLIPSYVCEKPEISLPDVLRIDLKKLIENPISVAEFLIRNGNIAIEGEVSADPCTLSACEENSNIYSFSDSDHFGSAVTSDGIFPPQEGAVDTHSQEHRDWVLPYILSGNCSVNGSFYYNLFELANIESRWEADYSFYGETNDREPDAWINENGASCDYNLSKLLAVFFIESRFLEP
jgi:hypothetical protein